MHSMFDSKMNADKRIDAQHMYGAFRVCGY